MKAYFLVFALMVLGLFLCNSEHEEYTLSAPLNIKDYEENGYSHRDYSDDGDEDFDEIIHRCLEGGGAGGSAYESEPRMGKTEEERETELKYERVGGRCSGRRTVSEG